MRPFDFLRSLTTVTLLCVAASACGDRTDNNININIGDDATNDTIGNDVAPDATADTGSDTTADTAGSGELCTVENGFGCSCNSNNDCNSSRCIEGPDGKMCTQECIESCPNGFDCSTVGGPGDGASICVPRHVSLCRPCRTRDDCRTGTDTTALCVPDADPTEGSFCASSCASLPCPDGYSCNDVLTGDGAATARLCLPVEGACECRPSWADLAYATDCTRTNAFGTCQGVRSCTADGLSECNAAAAAAEICNNSDDNCDGIRDNITPEACELSTSGIATTCPGTTACANGALTCSGRSPAAEICDGIDNDCDGGPETSTTNCLDSGCVPVAGTTGYVQNGAPTCFNGGCVYANPTPCGYFTCNGGGSNGDVCATSCSDDSRCIANAACVGGACQCRPEYAGATCQLCANGFQDFDNNGTCTPNCATTACVQGVCDDASGTALCACNEGHVGAACDACDAPNYSDADGDGVCTRRGAVLAGPAPGTIARVGKAWRFRMAPTQDGFMSNDNFVFSLPVAPATMAINATTGEIVWTPSAAEQTWDEDPTLAGAHDVTIRATAPDGQFAEHVFELEVLPPVAVRDMHPAVGRANGGEAVLVFGSGFVGPAGSIRVNFGDVPATAVTVVDSNTLSVTTPPAFALTRPLVMVVDGDPDVSLTPGFTHLPTVAFADTETLAIGSNIIVNGAGFDPSGVSANAISVAARNGTTRRITASTTPDAAEAIFTLGTSGTEGQIVTGAWAVMVNGLTSNYLPLTITSHTIPASLAVTSTDGPRSAGGAMKLRGAGFAGLTTTNLGVAFATATGTTPATVTAINVTGTEVTVTVPAGAVTGPVTLSATGRTTAKSFVVAEIPGTNPALWTGSLTPELGAPGSAVVIRGSGFSNAAPGDHVVTFDGVVARVLSAESNRLVVEVPAGLPIGPARISVTVGGATDASLVFGVSREATRIAGGATAVNPPASTDPRAYPVSAAAVAAESSGLVFFSGGGRISAVNTSNAAITAFGRTIAAGQAGTLAEEQAARAYAVRPLGGDLFFASGNQIFRMRRNDGVITLYAGLEAAGNGGDGLNRLQASFSTPNQLAFTSNSVLLIADHLNARVRAINTTGSSINLWGLALSPDVVYHVSNTGAGEAVPGMAVDGQNNVFVSNFSRVSKVAFNRLPPTDPAYAERVAVIGIETTQGVLPTTGCPASGQVLGVISGLSFDGATNNLYIGTRHGVMLRVPAAGGADANGIDGDDCVEHFAGLPLTAAGVPRPGYSGDGGAAHLARIGLTVRPFAGVGGSLLITADGLLRRVAAGANANDRIITTVAGALPTTTSGQPALSLTDAGITGIVVDATRNRAIYSAGASRIMGHDFATGIVTLIAGTGIIGNGIPANGLATGADLAAPRGMFLRDNRYLYIMEHLLPRVSMVDLTTGILTVVAGDGRRATDAEQKIAGPASNAFVAIRPNNPRGIVGPDGLIYFNDNSYVRVINPTNAAVTSFGITTEAGGINWLPADFGLNLTAMAFDAAGRLWVSNVGGTGPRLSRISQANPTTPETMIARNNQPRGRPMPGRLGDISIERPTELLFLPNGDLLMTLDDDGTMLVVRANNGAITADSLVAPIMGIGTGGSWRNDRPVSAQANIFMAATLGPNNTVLFGAGPGIFTMPLN